MAHKYNVLLLLAGVFFVTTLFFSFSHNTQNKKGMVVRDVLLIPKTVTKNILQHVVPRQKERVFHYSAPWDKELLDVWHKGKGDVFQSDTPIKGGIVPHHLVSGHTIAAFFSALVPQDPSTIVLIGPSHFTRGQKRVFTTMRDWKTPYGVVEADEDVIVTLKKHGLVTIDEDVIKEEHSIYSILPFIKKSLPDATIVPLIVEQGVDLRTLDTLIATLIDQVPKDAVFVSSVDFSHYQTRNVAGFHDVHAKHIINTFDYARLKTLEIDSQESVYMVLQLMEHYGTQKVVHERHTNSADIGYAPYTLETTSHYSPYFVFGEKEEKGAVSILHFGDIMLNRGVSAQIKKHGQEYIFEKLAGTEERFFSGVDIVTGNLEGPFVASRIPTTKSIAFRFDPALIPMLKQYNFSLFSLANNHSLDMGSAGFAESKEHLDAAGIAYYGRQFGVDNTSYTVQDVGNTRIGFVGFNDTNTQINEQKAQDIITQAGEESDHVVVNIHWGVEYNTVSHPRQRHLAHMFIDAGADAVIGHHPHVVQEMEIYKKRPIFYSLGNTVFDQYFSVETQTGLAVGIVFEEHAMCFTLIPLQSELSQVYQMPPKKAEVWVESFVDKSHVLGYDIDSFSCNYIFYEGA